MNRSDELLAEVRRLWAPAPKLKLSDWVEQHFRLSSEYSAKTGRLTLYTFQRGPLDAFTDPYVREVVIMSATQMLKTLTLQCIVAYTIACDPGPILLAQPTETDAETFSKERLSPMCRDMPCLRDVVAPEKRTSSANTTLHKVFRGGSLSLVGAQTAGNFARRSIRVFLSDERDKWRQNVGKEGDGYSLGVKRTATFRSRAKIVQVCSPTIEGNSQIADAYEQSDQRKLWIPCPHCGTAQILAWPQVKWDDGDPATARYHCSTCDVGWTDVERWAAVERGEWRAEKPFEGVAGFWISELYSPWKTLRAIAGDFLAKKDDPAALQTFVNTSLAETWREQGESPDFEKLMARREESYSLGQVPPGVLFLTAGVDVQKTWLEGYVWGWGRGKQRWVVDRFRIEDSPFNPPAWHALTERLNEVYRTEAGLELPITRMGVDTGFATQEAYQWARSHGSSRVLALDGRNTGVALIGSPSVVDVTVGGRKIARGGKLWPVNVSMCKSELYGLLGKERPADGEPYPAGWVHFPSDIDEEFFRQLTAEQLTTRIVKGYRKTEWIKIRERNEALDCANYARAAASQFGIDRFSDHRWADLEQQSGTHTTAVAAQAPAATERVVTSAATPIQRAQIQSPVEAFLHPARGGGRFERSGGGRFNR